jgi:hypothetical protein
MADTSQNFSDMTDEEYWALDDEVTRNPPNLTGKPGGFFTERAKAREAAEADQTVHVDRLTAGWLRAKVASTHKTPAELIGELVREKIATSA